MYRLCVGIFDSKWGFFDRWRNIWIKKCYFIGILNLLGGTKMKKNLFAKTLKTVAEKGVKIGINRKCVAVYHEIDAPEKAKNLENSKI